MWVMYRLLQPICPHLHAAAQTCTGSSSKPGVNPKSLKTVDPSLLISLLVPKYRRKMITLLISVQPAVTPPWAGGAGHNDYRRISLPWPGNQLLAQSWIPAWLRSHAQRRIACHHSKCVINIIIEETYDYSEACVGRSKH